MLWAVIIAGGGGTRFWPVSRQKTPKQFLSLFGKKSLLEDTCDRLRGLIPSSRILVVTSRENVRDVRRLLKLPPSQVIGEPCGRNTAPPAILAAQLIQGKDPDAILAILPADHRIEKVKTFQRALSVAASATEKHHMPVTFGIKPAFAHTGYGYLEVYSARHSEAEGRRIQGSFASLRMTKIFRVKRFHEKPNLTKAKAYLKSGRHFWNSGMFVWRADDLLATAKKHLPKAYQLISKGVRPKRPLLGLTPFGLLVPEQIWHSMPNISIDYGLMEPLKGKILAIPVNIGWSDLGGWNAYSEFLPRDAKDNRSHGHQKLIAVESGDNVIQVHPSKLVALVGVKGLVIVDTENAILVCAKDKTEQIREIVSTLKQKKFYPYL